ncbi:2-hydroxychromene-2-carboxylate isomerase [Streptomyces gobiensis]|uniref:2-hydroxychromene-2-carboxylate isomerase n=1 Tax=Streptomyces gobiensis TaxID=2875706 RepID=UPI001E3FB92A|nr:DsbA family protein [Streptomyces gobiensis]UGY94200.1 DsbA family protein [Streptomyces gobiensis]
MADKATAKPGKGPRWYFSLRSPYSWMAYRDLTERYPDVADAIEWIPFWEPDEQTAKLLAEAQVELPIVPMSRAKNFYILQDTARLSKARGWTMSWPIDRDPNWEVSHLGYLVAADAGQGRAFIDRVYKARWEQNRDICDREVIGDIGAELGLDAERVANASDDAELRRRGVAALTRSYKDGLFGVPFFVHRRDKYFGVDRLRAYVASMRGEEAPAGDRQSWLDDLIELPELVTPGGDAGHAGGCG